MKEKIREIEKKILLIREQLEFIHDKKKKDKLETKEYKLLRERDNLLRRRQCLVL
jgi:hypothetical protein